MKAIRIKFKTFPSRIPDSFRIYGALIKFAFLQNRKDVIESILEGNTIVSSLLPFHNGSIFFPYPFDELAKKKTKRYKNTYVNTIQKNDTEQSYISKINEEIPRVSINNFKSKPKIYYVEREFFMFVDGDNKEIVKEGTILVRSDMEKEIIKLLKTIGIVGLSQRVSQGFGGFDVVDSFEPRINREFKDLLISKYIPNKIDDINLDASFIRIDYISGKTNEGKDFGPITYIKEGSKISINSRIGKTIDVGKKYIVGHPFIL